MNASPAKAEGKRRQRDINDNLFKGIDELELSVRATNCLRSANIATVGELVQRPEAEMLKTKNFGRSPLTKSRPCSKAWDSISA